MFLFSNLSIQGIHSFNARIGEWEHNGDIVGGPGSEVVGLNGLSFILHFLVFSYLGKVYTIGRYDYPHEVHTFDMRTGKKSTACPRAENHTRITAGVV